jgi:hypothetical protein
MYSDRGTALITGNTSVKISNAEVAVFSVGNK